MKGCNAATNGSVFWQTRGSADRERRLAAQLAGDRKFFQVGEALLSLRKIKK